MRGRPSIRRRGVVLALTLTLVAAAPASAAPPDSKRCVTKLTAPEKVDLSRSHWRAVLRMEVRWRSEIGPAVLRRAGRRGLAPSVRPGKRRVSVTLPRTARAGRYRLVLRVRCGKQRQVVRRTIRLVP